MIPHTQFTTRQQFDLLTAAFSRHQDALEAWERWRGSVDWNCKFDPATFSLLPKIQRNLSSLGVPDPLMSRFKGVGRQAWLANRLWIQRMLETLEVCSRNHVDLLFLPPTRRLLLDSSAVMNRNGPIHVAVRSQHAERTIRLLLRNAWRSVEIRLPQKTLTGFTLGTHYLLLRHDNGMFLTLNWGLKILFREDAGYVWDRVIHADLCGRRVAGLDAADALECVLRNPVAMRAFDQMTDVLMVASEPGLDWKRLARALHNRPIQSDWLTVLAFVQPIIKQWCTSFEPADWCKRDTGHASSRRGSLLARAKADWRQYRASLGEHHALNTALKQLPGYLVGRWNLAGIRHIPLGFMYWAIRG